MPHTEPLIKNGPNGVSNRRQKITIDGHTATRGHFQHLRRQSRKSKSKAKAQAKRLAADLGRLTLNEPSEAASARNTTRQQRTESGEEATASPAASSSSQMHYFDYKRAEMMEMVEDEALAAWAAAATEVSGGRIKAKRSEGVERPVAPWMETTLTLRPAKKSEEHERPVAPWMETTLSLRPARKSEGDERPVAPWMETTLPFRNAGG